MTVPVRQLGALLALRWQMARQPGPRLGMLVAAALLGWLLVLAMGSADALDVPTLATAVELAPTAYLGFGLLAVVAPLTAGGGAEVVPPEQLVAYPVRPSTQFYGGLLLAPANLVWAVQLLALTAMTGYLTVGGSLALGAVTSGAYVLASTVAGQALAWIVVGLRQTRRGRRAVVFGGLALLAASVLTVRSGYGDAVLAASPTRSVVAGVVAGGEGELSRWGFTTGALLLLLVAGVAVGSRACGWALRLPGDAGAGGGREPVRRRAEHRSALRELVAVDRASVWRAPALRRGGLVLAVLPGVVAAGAAVPWDSMIVLPGLVAAGAGLLFGINAFCLDGSGAVWLASLPHEPRLVFRAKAIVLAETVLAAVVLAAVAGAVRSPGTPDSAQVTAVVASSLVSTVVVVAVALGISVRRPHRADLLSPRDAVAPPGALAVTSLRMAMSTALVGILMTGSARVGGWGWPLLVALPVLLLCGLSLRRSALRYADPVARSRIVHTVSAG